MMREWLQFGSTRVHACRFGSIEEIPDDDIKEFGRKGFPDKHRVEIWKYELEVIRLRNEIIQKPIMEFHK